MLVRTRFVVSIHLAVVILSSLMAGPYGSTSSDEKEVSASEVPTALENTPTPVPDYKPVTQPQLIEAPQDQVPAQVLIQFAPNTTQEERAAYVQSVGGTPVESLDSLDTVAVTMPEEVAHHPSPITLFAVQGG